MSNQKMLDIASRIAEIERKAQEAEARAAAAEVVARIPPGTARPEVAAQHHPHSECPHPVDLVVAAQDGTLQQHPAQLRPGPMARGASVASPAQDSRAVHERHRPRAAAALAVVDQTPHRARCWAPLVVLEL